MSDPARSHFVCEFSEPVDRGNGTVWWRNTSLNVMCSTLDRAVEMCRERHPDARLHVVRRVGTDKEILIDD